MTKKLMLVALLLLYPASSFAVNNIGTCGWGSKLFDGNEGIAPQVLAATTNGTSGNQTFGISSGTSGCTQNGVVQTNWKTAMFIDSNMNKLAKDMSAGRGETLETLASLLNMTGQDKQVFFETTKSNFAEIFPADDASSVEVTGALRRVMERNEVLAQYAKSI
jgi:hypothetical protein